MNKSAFFSDAQKVGSGNCSRNRASRSTPPTGPTSVLLQLAPRPIISMPAGPRSWATVQGPRSLPCQAGRPRRRRQPTLGPFAPIFNVLMSMMARGHPPSRVNYPWGDPPGRTMCHSSGGSLRRPGCPRAEDPSPPAHQCPFIKRTPSLCRPDPSGDGPLVTGGVIASNGWAASLLRRHPENQGSPPSAAKQPVNTVGWGHPLGTSLTPTVQNILQLSGDA